MTTYTDDEKIQIVMSGVRREMAYAERVHGRMPDDLMRSACIVAEEAGEVLKAALDITRPGADRLHGVAPPSFYCSELITELRQTASSALKFLIKLEIEFDHPELYKPK